MCSVENTVIYAVFGIKSVQNSGFCSVFKALASKHVQCRDHVPMPLANSNIHTKNRSKALFFAVFLHFFRQKRCNLHVFRLKVGPKHWFFAVFSMLWHPKTIQNIAIYSVFSFLSVFPLPEADQNDPKFRFNTILSSDSQKSSKNHANTTNTRSRCEIVFGLPPS